MPCFVFAQIQVGQDIIPEDVSNAGFSLTLSSDGQTLGLVGSAYNSAGHSSSRAKVYTYNGTAWQQKGQALNLNESSNTYLHPNNSRISLSSDGNTAAISAYYSNSASGTVRIYQYNGNSWQQKGQDILGGVNDVLGYNIELSTDGTMMAIVAGGMGAINMGYVVTYKYNGSEWQQMGQKIMGTNNNAYISFDQARATLSTDGMTMAIGSPFSKEHIHSNVNGQVLVYHFNGTYWEQKGQVINNDMFYNLGWDVSISGDGNNVATTRVNFQGFGLARVYTFDEGQWTQKGQDLIGEQYADLYGDRILLSSDASTLVVSAVETSKVMIYKYIENIWSLVGLIEGVSSYYYGLSLASNGHILALGSPVFLGIVSVYDLSDVLSSDKHAQTQFLIYPNPVQDNLNVIIDQESELIDISVFNVFGQLVQKHKTTTFDVSQLKSGKYFIQLKTTKGKTTHSFIKK